ncbi:hypothetical protein SAMN05192584_12947 [Streptomyces pini]|uniref:Uncharacterized protein n=1 Tax=Streptomyces pini TaxID=1520580 RepID=A0A1I4L3Y3_9ACTN|nr:hypothetical protein SAMN05192584_12947 [Streptomyces pini]
MRAGGAAGGAAAGGDGGGTGRSVEAAEDMGVGMLPLLPRQQRGPLRLGLPAAAPLPGPDAGRRAVRPARVRVRVRETAAAGRLTA